MLHNDKHIIFFKVYNINKEGNDWMEFISVLRSPKKGKGNVNEYRTVLVKNLIKKSFYGKRKKSN